MSESKNGLEIAEAILDERISDLEGIAETLVPDVTEVVDPERRAVLKKEKEEVDIRLNELKLILKKMREN